MNSPYSGLRFSGASRVQEREAPSSRSGVRGGSSNRVKIYREIMAAVQVAMIAGTAPYGLA